MDNNDIITITSSRFGSIRLMVIDGEVWFCGRDVCNALGYKNTRDAIAKHCSLTTKKCENFENSTPSQNGNCKMGIAKYYTTTKGGSQVMTYINKPNLLNLINRCRLDGAEYFEEWIFKAAYDAVHGREIPSFKPLPYLSSANTPTSNAIVKSDTYINQKMSIPAYNGENAPKTTVLVTYEGLENVQGLTPFNFTPLDRLVFDAVCTINQAARKSDKSTIFTAEMVARAMHGKVDAEYMSPQVVSAVSESLDKMTTMFIVIDATAHLRSKNIAINEFKYKGYLLPMESIHVNAGGAIVDSYELLKTPFLFRYASMVGQVVNIENELLNIRKLTADGRITDKYLQINIDKQILVRQLATRIDRIKKSTSRSKKKQSNIILFETLFKESGINTGGHSERLKAFIFNVLDYYKALEHIKYYNKRTASGRKGCDAIEIII